MSTSEVTLPRPGEAIANPDFDLETYLRQRDLDPAFSMLEFGHGSRPVAYRQPAGFTGQRMYIGAEAWLRSIESSGWAELEENRAKHHDQNIVFIDQELDASGTAMQRKLSRLARTLGFVGLYDPSTVLPDESVDEILLSNVFGDPLIAHHKRRTRRLLNEASRLVSEEGMIVIRETITPKIAKKSLTDSVLHNAGLQTAGFCTPEEPLWKQLEEVYGAGRKYIWTPNFYQFLTKTSADQASN